MDGVSLANTKAQWDEALQGAIAAFRLLVSQSNAKAWKPVVAPNQPFQPGGATAAAGAASTSSSSPARAIISTPNGSLAHRSDQRRPSVPFSSSHDSASSSLKGKSREIDFDQQHPSLSSSPSISSIHADRSDADTTATATPTAANFPSRNIPFLPRPVDPSAVKLHRRNGGKAVGLSGSADVHRAVVDVPFEGDVDLHVFRNSLSTPEARTKWDPMVDHAESIEMLDPQTQVAKTDFKLGWPASPRDAITISRTIQDANTLIFVSTSLPRSADAPAYLRPAPPFVRSHVHLFAWCVHFPQKTTHDKQPTLRITVFHAWDLRGAWLGMPPGGLATHLTSTIKGLIKFVRKGASALPALRTWGPAIEVLSTSYETTRDTLAVEYCITAEDFAIKDIEERSSKDAETLAILSERKAVGNSIRFALPAEEGWDVKVIVKAQFLNDDGDAQWKATAFRQTRPSPSSQVTLQLDHARLQASDESIRAQITVQRIAASSDIRLRINDETYHIQERDDGSAVSGPSSSAASLAVLHEASTLSDISVHSTATAESQQDTRHRTTDSISQFSTSKRNAAIGPVVRRNYIYFTSMLQEPDAKWKHLSDSRGVTVTQLDSIDPTLVVYRAEATFVNVGVWDIFAAISSPGTRAYWDKSLEETKLLQDVGNVSTLWHTKTKAAWPVSPRDSVEIETSYKSPSSVHIFSFSTDDRNLFPSIPSPALGTIRTQVDLRGWSVESLSPTTVHVTLIEQSDPRGWTSKSATPSAMIAAVAGVGEHAIKMGAPPVLTRILDATVTDLKYDYEKATFRLDYSRNEVQEGMDTTNVDSHNVECELRCDLESWAANLDLLVDPPPINVSCLRRHKLSPGGGGLWITIEHDPASLEDDAARVTVRRGAVTSPTERGIVWVNGAKIKVDVDELKETEVAQLKDRKRGKPQRVPLDMRQKARPDAAAAQSVAASNAMIDASVPSTPLLSGAASIGSVPSRVGSPAPPELANAPRRGTPFSDKQPKYAITPALDVLFLLRRIYAERSPDPAVTPAGWAGVTQRNGLYVRKRLMQSISPTVMVQRGDKVVQGVTAEDMVAAVSSLGCRKQWDERIESSKILESYGDGTTTSFITTSGAFPFRGRGFYLASLTSRAAPPSSRLGRESLESPSSGIGAQNVYYHAAASFPEEACDLDANQVNRTALPIGKVLIDGWIFETLDPYSSTLNYQIPSTRCTHIVAIDYAGSLPVAVNTMWNSTLPRSILAVENYVKAQGAVPSVRAPPAFVQVLGDGRDEDHDFVWSLADGLGKRPSSLLYSNFSASDRRLEVLLQLKKLPKNGAPAPASASSSNTTPVSSRFLRTPTVSNASTTKASAQAAVSSSSLSRSTSMQDDLADAGSVSNGDIGAGGTAKSTSIKPAKTPSSLLAPGFQGSLRAPRASLRGGDIRPRRPTVLADVEVELKHYAAGYKVEVLTELMKAADDAERQTSAVATNGVEEAPTAEDGRSNGPIPANGSPPLETQLGKHPQDELAAAKGRKSALIPLDTIAMSKKEIPVIVTVYDLPPSAVLAATLDPSARPRRHLLRLTLPESMDSRDGSSDESAEGAWRDKLALQDACIRVVIRPVRAEGASGVSAASAADASKDRGSTEQTGAQGQETEDIDSQQVPVHYGGERMEVVHVNKTSTMLQREHSTDPGISILQRVPHTSAKDSVEGDGTGSTDDVIPRALARPIAAASLLQKKAEPVPLLSSRGQQTERGRSEGYGVAADKDKNKADAPGTKEASKDDPSQQPKSASTASDEKKEIAASSATTSLMGLLQSYPLSRLGASTALSTVSATGEGARKPDGEKAQDGSGNSSTEGTKDKGQDAGISTASQITSMLPDSPTALLGGRALHEARFSLATIIVVALICFLAGSLLRAMLSPADFVFYSPRSAPAASAASDVAGVAASEVQRLLGGGGEGVGSDQVAWRKILRLLEIKRAVAGRFDLVLAVVDRRL